MQHQLQGHFCKATIIPTLLQGAECYLWKQYKAAGDEETIRKCTCGQDVDVKIDLWTKGKDIVYNWKHIGGLNKRREKECHLRWFFHALRRA